MRLRRLAAFAIDWLLLAVWGALLFGIVTATADGSPSPPSGPWHAQALAFGAVTLLFTLYFALCERSRWRASLGKRWVGLQVTDSRGRQLGLPASLLRNGLKFLPWELGHVVAQHEAFGNSDSLPGWLWAFVAASCLLPVWWNGAILTTGVAPYDRWARARVARATS